MTLNLTFKDVCATIKKQGKDDPKLIEAVDQLLGLALKDAEIQGLKAKLDSTDVMRKLAITEAVNVVEREPDDGSQVRGA